MNTCIGAALRRHLPVGKDGPCAGTKGYRAPEVHASCSSNFFRIVSLADDFECYSVFLMLLLAHVVPGVSLKTESTCTY